MTEVVSPEAANFAFATARQACDAGRKVSPRVVRTMIVAHEQVLDQFSILAGVIQQLFPEEPRFPGETIPETAARLLREHAPDPLGQT